MTALRALSRQPWLWSWVGSAAVWLAIVVFTGGQGGVDVLTAALTFAALYVLVALGQMFVVTLGPGKYASLRMYGLEEGASSVRRAAESPHQ